MATPILVMSESVPLRLCVVLVTLLPWRSEGHGRLLEPPSRASMWRLGYNTPKNYLDNQMFCGGFSNQWGLQGGRCGVCGDPWQGPREHEAGGKYATGLVTRRYQVNAIISVLVQITASHKGYFEFRLCPVNNPNMTARPECFDRHLLQLADGSGTRFPVTRTGPYNYGIKLQLPKTLECSQCVLQWKYNAGNSWGVGEDGRGCAGCGQQEQFYGCADIAIGAMMRFVPYVAPTTRPYDWTTRVFTRPLTTTTSVPPVSTTTTAAADDVLDISSDDWATGLDTLLKLLTVDTDQRDALVNRTDTRSSNDIRRPEAKAGTIWKDYGDGSAEEAGNDDQRNQDSDVDKSVRDNIKADLLSSERSSDTIWRQEEIIDLHPDGDKFGFGDHTSLEDEMNNHDIIALAADFPDSDSYSIFDSDAIKEARLIYDSEEEDVFGGSTSVLEYPKEGRDDQMIIESPLLYREQYQPDGYYEYDSPSHVYYSSSQAAGLDLDQEYIGGDLNYFGEDQQFVGDDLQYAADDQQDSVQYFRFFDRGLDDVGASGGGLGGDYDYGGLLNDILGIVNDQPKSKGEEASNDESLGTITGHHEYHSNTSEASTNLTGSVVGEDTGTSSLLTEQSVSPNLGNSSIGSHPPVESNETTTTGPSNDVQYTVVPSNTLDSTTECQSSEPLCRRERVTTAHKYNFLEVLKKSARTSTNRPAG